MNFLAGIAKAAQPAAGSDHPDKAGNPSDLLSSAKLVAEAAQAQFNHQPDKVDNTKVAGAAAALLDAATEYGKLDETQGVGKYLGEAEGYLRKYSTSGEPTEAPASDPADEHKAPAEPTQQEKPPIKAETESAEEKIPPAAAEPTEEKPAPDKAPAAVPAEEESAPEKKIDTDPEEEKGPAAAPAEEESAPAKKIDTDPEEEEPAPEKKVATVPEEEEKAPVATPAAESTEEEEKAPAPAATEAAETEKAPAGGDDYVKVAEGLLNKASGGDSGVTEYAKLAEGFLNKTSGDKSEGGGYGEIANLAGGFFKK